MNNRKQTHRIALLGMLFAVALVLNLLEGMIPPIAALPPGVKLGLSNIVTMYCLFVLGKRYAFLMALLKAGFVLLTRGFTAGALSLGGGLCSIVLMLLALWLSRQRASYLVLSVLGGVAHNLGQIALASLILETPMLFYYFPVLLVSGVIAGSVTATLLRVVMPHLSNLYK